MLSAPLLVLLYWYEMLRRARQHRERGSRNRGGAAMSTAQAVSGWTGNPVVLWSSGPICSPTSVSPLQAHCAGAAWRHPIRARAAGRRADWSGSLLECAAAYVLCTVLRTADVVRSNLNRRVRPSRPCLELPQLEARGCSRLQGRGPHYTFLPSCPPALLLGPWSPI